MSAAFGFVRITSSDSAVSLRKRRRHDSHDIRWRQEEEHVKEKTSKEGCEDKEVGLWPSLGRSSLHST